MQLADCTYILKISTNALCCRLYAGSTETAPIPADLTVARAMKDTDFAMVDNAKV